MYFTEVLEPTSSTTTEAQTHNVAEVETKRGNQVEGHTRAKDNEAQPSGLPQLMPRVKILATYLHPKWRMRNNPIKW